MKTFEQWAQHYCVSVIGGGINGLCTAIRLRQKGYRVTCYSHREPHETTSATAAAFGLPVLSGVDPRIPDLTVASLERLEAYANNPASGVSRIRLWVCFVGTSTKANEPDLSWLSAFKARRLKNEELPGDSSFGFELQSYRMQMETYLPFLKEQASNWLGVEFVKKHVTLESLPQTDLIVNCTGISARKLVPDPSVSPIRGQVVLVSVPVALKREGMRPYDVLIREGIGGDNTLDYIVFRDEDVLLGGTAETSWDLKPSPDQTREILAKCAKLVPELSLESVIEERVGLRPFRPMLRLNVEFRDQMPPIVHNYGHGGSGVTLSWGCAEEVNSMVSACAWDQFQNEQGSSRQRAA